VQKELNLSADQAGALKGLAADVKKGTTKAADAQTKLTKTLKADQLARLEEISYQVRGGAALLDEKVANALKLTKKQTASLAETWKAEEEALKGSSPAPASARPRPCRSTSPGTDATRAKSCSTCSATTRRRSSPNSRARRLTRRGWTRNEVPSGPGSRSSSCPSSSALPCADERNDTPRQVGAALLCAGKR
jgi:hypothetical protein